MFAMVVDDLVYWDLDGYWPGDPDWHMLLDWYRHRFFNMVWYFLLNLVRYWLLHRDGNGLDHWNSNWLGHFYVDGVRLWYGYSYWFGHWYWHGVRNWNSFVFVYWDGYVLGNFHGVRDVVMTTPSTIAFMISVTACISGIYGDERHQKCYVQLQR